MNRLANTVTRTQPSVLATNKVIRNTYILLSMTLLFSAVTAGLSMVLNLPHPGMLLTMVGYFGLLFLTNKFRNSWLWAGFRIRPHRFHGCYARAYTQHVSEPA